MTGIKPNSDSDSVFGIGRIGPNITEKIFFRDGTSSDIFVDPPNTTIPTNAPYEFPHNEFAIFNDDRCVLRYIILFSRKQV